jgi:excisionase family DNA binding protein
VVTATSKYLDVGQTAALLGVSKRTVHGLTAANKIPFRRLPYGKKLCFEPEWLEAWADGCELEVVHLVGGGKICRPIVNGKAKR